MNSEEVSFHNNESDNQFVVRSQGAQGKIEYEKHSPDHLDLFHTEVDPELAGKGIAKVLVQRALEFCKANEFKVTPTCTYVAEYIKRHPEYQYLVKENLA